MAGDIIGSVFEWHNFKTTEFPLFSSGSTFTDDTVHTLALADSYMSGAPYAQRLKEYYQRYPHAGYGGMFHGWAGSASMQPYNSFGNGAAMRASPAGWFSDTLEETLKAAGRSAAVPHNHPEGIKGAQATAAAVFLGRTGASKEEIRLFTVEHFGYNLDRRLDDIRPFFQFNETCQKTVPEAITAFLELASYENAVRLAISLGGDSDALACITGGIAEAFYGGIPPEIEQEVYRRLDEPLGQVAREFVEKYVNPRRFVK